MGRDGPTPYLFEEFERLVGETVAWCGARADSAEPASSLRSVHLNPGVCFWDREPFPWSGETLEFSCMENAHTVGRLARRRREALAADGAHRTPDPDQRGRILLSWPHDSVASQAAHVGSRGFFARNSELPPWDTWIAYLTSRSDLIRGSWNKPRKFRHDVLVCWVPGNLVPLAESGLQSGEIPLGEWVPDDLPTQHAHDRILKSLAGD